MRYGELEKLAYALVVASQKLANALVLMNFPLRQVLQKPEALGRILKWAIDLS